MFKHEDVLAFVCIEYLHMDVQERHWQHTCLEGELDGMQTGMRRDTHLSVYILHLSNLYHVHIQKSNEIK